MGIKFDILSDAFILNEASDFTKFFTSIEPINTIHKELKIDADTKLVLVPSENRHDLWVELRNGKAIFGVINNKREFIDKTYENLLSALKNLGVPPNRARTYNEIKTAILRFGEMISAKDPSISSGDILRIRNRIQGQKQSQGLDPITNELRKIKHKGLLEQVEEIYPGNTTMKLALEEFLMAIKPGNRILVKRIPTNYGTMVKFNRNTQKVPSTVGSAKYGGPENRYFRTPKPGSDEKIFGQEYTVWIFDGDKLLRKEEYSKNAIKVYNPLFDGWADRDMYVIEDAKFLGRQHPFISSKPAETIDQLKTRLNDMEAEIEVLRSKYQTAGAGLRADKLGRNIAEKSNAIRNIKTQIARLQPKASISFTEILPMDSTSIRNFTQSAFAKYEKALTNKIRENATALKQKVTADIEDLSASETERNQTVNEYRKALKILKEGITHIDQRAVFDEFVQKDINLKIDDYLIIRADTPFITFDPYQVMQKDQPTRPEWEIQSKQAGAERIKAWTVTGPEQTDYNSGWGIALGFQDVRKYNDFVRKFILYALRTVVKAPELQQLENIFAEL